MCKLFVSTGPLTKAQSQAMILAANRLFRQTERDGFGFLSAGAEGAAWGRYLVDDKFTGFGQSKRKTNRRIEHGELRDGATALIVHGRTSTNALGIDNCHPFHIDGQFLAHNGVVTYVGDEAKPPAACDSHQFLQWMMRGRSFDEAHDSWEGWGAMAHYDFQGQALTIARDGAQLYVAHRLDGCGFMFATSPIHLNLIAEAAGISISTERFFPKGVARFVSGHVSVRMWKGFAPRSWTRLDELATVGGWQANDDNPNPTTREMRRAYQRRQDKPVRTHRPVKLNQGTLFPDWYPRSGPLDDSPSSTEYVTDGARHWPD